MHYNKNLSHQVDHALAFQKCGFEITSSPDSVADIHVVSGPYFAYNQWRNHPRTLMIDRALWGDPDCVSIGWLNPDGTRRFASGDKPRPKPDIYEWKQPWSMGELSCLILADYNQDIDKIAEQARRRFVQVCVRYHPADQRAGKIDKISLGLHVSWYDCVIATSGTAVFEAIIRGIPAICLDPANLCAPVCANSIDAEMYRGDRDDWLHRMSYTQFSLSEIADGTAWGLLKDAQ